MKHSQPSKDVALQVLRQFAELVAHGALVGNEVRVITGKKKTDSEIVESLLRMLFDTADDDAAHVAVRDALAGLQIAGAVERDPGDKQKLRVLVQDRTDNTARVYECSALVLAARISQKSGSTWVAELPHVDSVADSREAARTVFNAIRDHFGLAVVLDDLLQSLNKKRTP